MSNHHKKGLQMLSDEERKAMLEEAGCIVFSMDGLTQEEFERILEVQRRAGGILTRHLHDEAMLAAPVEEDDEGIELWNGETEEAA